MNTTQTWLFQDYCRAVLRFKWLVLTVLALAMGAAAVWLEVAPRKYDSNAKLFVRVGRENAALDPTLGSMDTVALNSSRESEMNSIVEHLRSRSILEKVLQVVDPDVATACPLDREEAIRDMKKAIYVNSPHMSTVVNIQGRAKDAAQAQKMVATLVDIYLEEHMRVNRTAGSFEFFVQQSNLLRGQLESAKAELRDAKIEAGVGSIEGRRTALEGQISTLETQIYQVSAERAAAEAKIRALKDAVDSVQGPLLEQLVRGTPNDGLGTMRQELFELRVREQELLSKYTPVHPSAVAVRKQILEVEAELKLNEPDRQQIISALSAQDVADFASLAVQEEMLRAQRTELDGKLAKLAEDEIVIEERTRKVDQLEAKHLTYVENVEQARMDQALKAGRISNVSIIQPATLEASPVHPRKASTLFLAFVAGTFGGVLLALGLDYLNPTPGRSEAARANVEGPSPSERQRRRSATEPQTAVTEAEPVSVPSNRDNRGFLRRISQPADNAI